MKIQLEIWKWELFLKWAKLKKWLRDNEPVLCADCQKISRYKNIVFEKTLMCQSLPICKKCHTKWFPE